MRFCKRPVVVEAIPVSDFWDKDGVLRCDYPDWVSDAVRTRVIQIGSARQIAVATSEGVMVGEHTDWLIRGVKGELYPCKPDIFEMTYERDDGDSWRNLTLPVEYNSKLVDVIGDVEEFGKKFGVHYDGPVRVLPPDLADFRERFMQEEFQEYIDASSSAARWIAVLATAASSGREHAEGAITENLEQMLDALVDLVYVAIGTANFHGFNFREAWRRVQAANLKKERAVREGDSKRGTLYDVVKPPGWEAPDHSDLVSGHIHRRAR